MWECDSGENYGGGILVINIKDEFANKIWEDVLLSFITDDCEEA